MCSILSLVRWIWILKWISYSEFCRAMDHFDIRPYSVYQNEKKETKTKTFIMLINLQTIIIFWNWYCKPTSNTQYQTPTQIEFLREKSWSVYHRKSIHSHSFVGYWLRNAQNSKCFLMVAFKHHFHSCIIHNFLLEEMFCS